MSVIGCPWMLRKSLNGLFIYLFIYLFLGPHLQQMEVPRLEVELELQLLAYTTATVTWDLSCLCDFYTTAHGSARSLTH